MRKPLVIIFCAALSACAGVPKPPTVNGKHRSPINDPQTAGLLKLRSESAESRTTGAILRASSSSSRSPVVTAPVSVHRSPPLKDPSPLVYVVQHFAFGNTAFVVGEDVRSKLLPIARTAKRIVVRGRTDAKEFSIGDEQVAFQRARAVRAFLVHNGVPAENIYLNYVSGGDYAADNESASGRTQNRRVEISVYSASHN